MSASCMHAPGRCTNFTRFHGGLHRALLPQTRLQQHVLASSAQCRAKTRKAARTEETSLEEVKPSYATFSYGSGMQLFIAELPDGRLNMRQVFLTGEDNPDRITPVMRGDIEEEPAFYHVLPVEAFYSGDVMKGIEEKHELEQLVLVKIHCQDPYELDFRSVYCFDCQQQEFYRAQPLNARRDEIVDPVLRFMPQQRLFLIDDAAKMPAPDLIVDAKDAADQGVKWDLDPEVDEMVSRARRSGRGVYTQPPPSRPSSEEEEDDDESSIPEFDDGPDESPDLPAVDMA